MSDKDFLSHLKRGREEEFFRRKDQELIEKMRQDSKRDERTGEPRQEPNLPQHVKPDEPRTPTWRHPWIAAIVAAVALVGFIWVWMSA